MKDMNKQIIPLTKEGFEDLNKEYEDLRKKRPEVVKELATARDMGDRSENAAYKGARRKLSATDSRLRFLKKLINKAKVVNPSQTDHVEIGSQVIVEKDDKKITFYIVGEYEADPIKKKLSYMSPVGQALMGKKVNDIVSVTIPTETIKYKLIAIE